MHVYPGQGLSMSDKEESLFVWALCGFQKGPFLRHITSHILLSRAVVKSTFVESKTCPRPGLSSLSQDRVQRGSSPSQVKIQEVQIQVKSKSK